MGLVMPDYSITMPISDPYKLDSYIIHNLSLFIRMQQPV